MKTLLLLPLLALSLAILFTSPAYAGPVIVPPEDCDDGIDNDQDGFIDDDDLDCQIILDPAPGALPELPGFPGPDDNPLLGDFNCYWDSRARYDPSVSVDLRDQFGFVPQTDVGLINKLCTSVEKIPDVAPRNNFPPQIPDQHFTTYTITGEPVGETVFVRDQFGVGYYEVLAPVELWAPAEKFFVGGERFPDNNINTHYKCYEIQGNAPVDSVTLIDQFYQADYIMGQPTKLCAPVEKTDPERNVFLPETDDHLKCYEIDWYFSDNFEIFQRVTNAHLIDQFIRADDNRDDYTTGDANIQNSQELCVVASKIHWPPENGDVIGGELIPIETTSLLLAGAQSFSWMIPVTLSILGIGIFVVSRRT